MNKIKFDRQLWKQHRYEFGTGMNYSTSNLVLKFMASLTQTYPFKIFRALQDTLDQ